LLVSVLLAGTMLLGSASLPVRPLLASMAQVAQAAPAAGDDPCPEPNDEFQWACFLGVDNDAFGYISAADDVDAYRIEAFDTNVQAHIAITDAPAAYAFVLGNWAGEPIATSAANGSETAIDATLPLPGSYYVFVQSPGGDFSPTAPYRLGLKLTYANGDAARPRLRYSTEFRDAQYDGWLKLSLPLANDPCQSEIVEAPGDSDATFVDQGGRYMIRVNKTGIAEEWPRVASPPMGPDLDNFVYTADARVCDQDSAKGHTGFRIGFRWLDKYHQYSVVVDTEGRRTWLNKVDGDSMKSTVPLTEPIRLRQLDDKAGVYRTTIRCVGDDIQISINGVDLIHVTDSTFRHGRFNFVAASWGSGKPLASFDNVLMTTLAGAPR
jgi:hypothetical protein